MARVGANLPASASDSKGFVCSGKFALTCSILNAIYFTMPTSVSVKRTTFETLIAPFCSDEGRC